ncbi:MAG: V-type ATP synthase subunit I [Kiritimatiellia bacterium]
MIVPMKKVTILCLDHAKDETLEALRALGTVHLTHLQLPEGEDVDKARARLTYVQRALEILPHHPQKAISGKTADEVVTALWVLIHEQKDLKEKLAHLKHEKMRVEPYGNFDPESIRKLAKGGVHVKLYQAPAGSKLEAPEGAVIQLLSESKDGIFLAVLDRRDINMNAVEFLPPAQSLREIENGIAAAEKRLAETEEEIAAYGGDYPAVAQVVQDALDQVRYTEARAGMGGEKAIAYLQGYCPVGNMAAVERSAAEKGWGIVVAEPSTDDPVPTKLDNPKWIKPIKAIFDMTGILPGYHEVDISVPFLIFLSIFFAMLVGDAGYGVLFIGMTRFARRKMPKAPAYPFTLLYIMSGATIAWGILTRTVFGLPREMLAWLPYIPWLENDTNVMQLCFVIGAVHLSIAHLWNAWLLRKTPQALAHIGWTCTTWGMFFTAGMFVLGKAFPSWVAPVMIAGVVLIVLFKTPVKQLKSEWFGHAMLPLDLISNFTDVVSYLRLFAVGTAGFAVANAFNQMLSPMFGSFFGGLAAAVFLFLGHALNIALCGLGILVHGVRLNTLEFSSHMGVQWAGRPYNPFCKQSQKDHN